MGFCSGSGARPGGANRRHRLEIECERGSTPLNELSDSNYI